MDDSTQSNKGLRQRIVASLPYANQGRSKLPPLSPAPSTPEKQTLEVSASAEGVNITPNASPVTQTAKVSADNEGVNIASILMANY